MNDIVRFTPQIVLKFKTCGLNFRTNFVTLRKSDKIIIIINNKFLFIHIKETYFHRQIKMGTINQSLYFGLIDDKIC